MAAKVYLEGKKRVSINLVERGDRIFVNTKESAGSIHCAVTSVGKKKGKTTIFFSQVGNHPDRLQGSHRDEGVHSIALYK